LTNPAGASVGAISGGIGGFISGGDLESAIVGGVIGAIAGGANLIRGLVGTVVGNALGSVAGQAAGKLRICNRVGEVNVTAATLAGLGGGTGAIVGRLFTLRATIFAARLGPTNPIATAGGVATFEGLGIGVGEGGALSASGP